MDHRLENAIDSSHFSARRELRKKARIEGSFPATVRGVDAHGNLFEVEANLDNVSTNGLFVRIGRPVKELAPLLVTFRIPNGRIANGSGTVWAAHGIVRRTEKHDDGSCGLGMKFRKYREMEG